MCLRRRRALPVRLAAASLLLALAGSPPEAFPAPGLPAAAPTAWRDARSPGVTFVDAFPAPARELALAGGVTEAIALPGGFAYGGRSHDLAVATADGRLELLAGRSRVTRRTEAGHRVREPRAEAPSPTSFDVLRGVSPAPGSRILVRSTDEALAVRWLDFAAGSAGRVTFEVLLHRDGRVRYQYPSVRALTEGPEWGRLGRIAFPGRDGRGDLVLLADGVPARGFDLGSGGLAEVGPGPAPGAAPDQVTCAPDPDTWCDRVLVGFDGVPGTPDDGVPTCIQTAGSQGLSPCTQRVSRRWSFDEQEFCLGCPKVFYVRVDCGTRVHVPTHDVEAMEYRVIDVRTGQPLVLEAENECARRRDAGDPFLYCDACAAAGGIFPKDDEIDLGGGIFKPAGSCTVTGFGTFPETGCLAYRDAGASVAWGRPRDATNPDQDGDGFVGRDEMEVPPCETCSIPDCTCGLTTEANKATEEQVIDVLLRGDPGLSGVYRVEILSGGFVWQLFMNCDGSEEEQYSIYASCGEALADYQPLPELSLDQDVPDPVRVADASGCPISVEVEVTLCNIGGAAAASAPVRIDWSDPSIPPFAGDCVAASGRPLEPQECRTCSFVVPVGAAGLIEGTLTVDAEDLVDECSESPTAVRCDVEASLRRATFDACDTTGLPFELIVPEPITLECEAPGGRPADDPDVATWLDAALAVGGCGAPVVRHDAPDLFPSDCAPGHVTTVTFTATDECGETRTGSSTITVVDTTPPDLVAPEPVTLECTGTDGLPVDDPQVEAWLARASAADACSEPELRHDAPAIFPSGCGSGVATVVTFVATDGCGLETVLSSTVTVVDTTPPRVEVPEPITLECDGPGGIPRDDPRLAAWLASASARDTCSEARLHDDAPELFPAGCRPGATTVVTFTATDGCGLTTAASSSVTVVDTTPPRIVSMDLPGCSWPPSHRFACLEDVHALVEAIDDCEGPVRAFVESCSSDQPEEAPAPGDRGGQRRGNGDGHHAPDCAVAPDGSAACWRSERQGTSPAGRHYTFLVVAEDRCGNRATADWTVFVPHDQSEHDCPRSASAALVHPREEPPFPLP